MIWTYSPLIPGLLEGVLKNLLFIAQLFWLVRYLPDNQLTGWKSETGRVKSLDRLTKLTIVIVSILQLYEFFYIWVLKNGDSNLLSLYHPVVSVVSAIVNQILFFEMYVSIMYQ